jgi:Protein of Unknown function (DUF2784)
VGYLLVARAVVVVHLSFVVFLIVGGPLGRRFRAVVPAHLAAIVAAVAINVTGSECPLTVLEKHFLRLAGRTPYRGGFISHYLVEPVHPSGITGKVNLVLLAAWIVPTAVAYAVLGRRPIEGTPV